MQVGGRPQTGGRRGLDAQCRGSVQDLDEASPNEYVALLSVAGSPPRHIAVTSWLSEERWRCRAGKLV